MFEESHDKACLYLKQADHLLCATYPMIKEPRLLLTVAGKLFLALNHAMSAVLHFEVEKKRLSPFSDDFMAKFNLMKRHMNVDADMLAFILEMRHIVLEHEKSPVEFTRGKTFVICSDDYDYRSLSEKRMRAYLMKTGKFVAFMRRTVGA